MQLTKPILAAKPDPEELDYVIRNVLGYPLLGSPKLDGIRATVQGGKLLSRSLKPIRNTAMQACWGTSLLNGLDGELIVGRPTDENCFNRTTSQVSARDGGIDGAAFYVFGWQSSIARFDERVKVAASVAKNGARIIVVKHKLLRSPEELLAYEAKQLALGYEGIMVADPQGPYKQGRSTLREQYLVAIKRFVDAEAVVVGVEEQQHNTNAAQLDALGHSKRTSHKAGLIGKGTLGSFRVRALDSGVEFNIGAGKGLTDAERSALWAGRAKLKGQVIKFRYQKIGTMTKPRIPVFLGFRDKLDL